MCMMEMKFGDLAIFTEKSGICRLSQPTPKCGERRMRGASGCKQLRVAPYPAWQDCQPSFSLSLHTRDIAKLNLVKFMVFYETDDFQVLLCAVCEEEGRARS